MVPVSADLSSSLFRCGGGNGVVLEFWNFFGLLEFLGCWNFFLFGCCEKLIWVGVGYFLWEVIIKKVDFNRIGIKIKNTAGVVI